MTLEEVVKLCRLVKALCPSQQLDRYTPDAWALTLGHLDYDDAKTAVAKLASTETEPGKARYIEPGHIIGGVRRIREARLTRMPDPPIEVRDDTRAFLAWERRTRDEIASGRPVSGPMSASGARSKNCGSGSEPYMPVNGVISRSDGLAGAGWHSDTHRPTYAPQTRQGEGS